MIKILFGHYILQLRRSPILAKEAIQALILGIFGLYAIASMVFIGIAGGEIIRQVFPGKDIIDIGLSALLLYFLSDLIMRYFLQKYPVMNIKPYMVLPVGKSNLTHYLLWRASLHFFNFLPLFAAVPFLFLEIAPAYPLHQTIGFIVAAVCLPQFAGYCGFALNLSLGVNKTWPTIALVVVAFLLYAEYTGIFSILVFIHPVMGWLGRSGLAILLFPALLVWLYFTVFAFIRTRLNQSAKAYRVSNSIAGVGSTVFKRFGKNLAPLMQLELQIIQRLPRARQYALSSILVLFVPIFSWGESISPYLLLLYGFLLTSMIALNHGQLILSWNSTHFDLLLTRGTTVTDLFRAKYYMLAMSCALTWLLSLPYAFANFDFLWYTTSMLLFNSSISVFAYMILASAASRRIEPDAGGLMSMDGFGVGHYLIILPILVLPFALFAIGDMAGGSMWGLGLVAFTGALGLIFHKKVIDGCVYIFMKNRYRIASAFRNA